MRGHTVFTPTLTGQGERSHLLTGMVNLSTHIEDILAVFHYEGLRNVVLAGHSYGGMAITGVADRIPELISSLVYLDAFLPEDGQSLFDINIAKNTQAFLANAGNIGGLAVPAPPARLAPPITVAAITRSSSPWPSELVTEPSQPTRKTPATPAISPAKA